MTAPPRRGAGELVVWVASTLATLVCATSTPIMIKGTLM
jgi:hypothetical protein